MMMKINILLKVKSITPASISEVSGAASPEEPFACSALDAT